MLKENTLGTCRIRKPKTLWEWGNVFSKPYASATTPWRLRGKVDEKKRRRGKLNLDWFKSLTDHYLYNKLPIIPTRHRTQPSGPCRQNSYFCQFRRLQLSEISFFLPSILITMIHSIGVRILCPLSFWRKHILSFFDLEFLAFQSIVFVTANNNNISFFLV